MTLDPGAARLLRMLANGAQGEHRSAGPPSIEARRDALVQLAMLTADPPDPAVKVEVLRYPRRGSKGPLALRLYRHDERPAGLMIYLHGGGWVAGDLDTHDGVCRALALHSGCRVLALDYRRAPEHPFPAALDDAIDVVRWARRTSRRWGVSPNRIVLAGDSAGANLAAAAAIRLKTQGAALLLLLCPILELEPLSPSRQAFADGYFVSTGQFAQDLADYLAEAAPTSDPAASPLRAPSLAGHPPTLLHLAHYDPFRDEGLAYAERLTSAGVRAQVRVHPGMIHYFYALPRAIPYARAALVEIGEGVRAALASDARPGRERH